MRLVIVTGKAVELNFMWLPTWLGHNLKFKQAIEAELGKKIVGLELTDDNLDHINEMVLDYIVEQNPVEGLRDYLDGLKFVNA